MNRIIVVGGGASGMAAAIAAARKGANVTILEQNDKPGRKILSTGNGRCNLTNLQFPAGCYRGDDAGFAEQILRSFGSQEALAFFRSLGIFTKCRGDYVYPLNDQASAVRDALEAEAKQLGVQIQTNVQVTAVKPEKNGFCVKCGQGQGSLSASRVILACGSPASQVPGSTDLGYGMAKELGHSLSPVVPALTAFQAEGAWFRKVAGVRTEAEIALLVDGALAARDKGELQFTDYGISGIPVFQVSRHGAKGLQAGKCVTAVMDLIPSLTETEFEEIMESRRRQYGRRTAEACFNSLLPAKLAAVLLVQCGIDRMLWAEKIPEEKWKRMLELCKKLEVKVSAVKGLEKAQICAGGICTCEIVPDTLESQKVPGLYVTGELLDIDGICGGYNLHFAWATGCLAGSAAAEKEYL